MVSVPFSWSRELYPGLRLLLNVRQTSAPIVTSFFHESFIALASKGVSVHCANPICPVVVHFLQMFLSPELYLLRKERS